MFQQKGGHPKRITIESLQAELERYKKAVAEAAQDYKNALEDGEKEVIHHSSKWRKRLPKITLDQIIKHARKQHNVNHIEETLLQATQALFHQWRA